MRMDTGAMKRGAADARMRELDDLEASIRCRNCYYCTTGRLEVDGGASYEVGFCSQFEWFLSSCDMDMTIRERGCE